MACIPLLMEMQSLDCTRSDTLSGFRVQNPNNVSCICLSFKEQKSGENGKMNFFVCHNKNATICFVRNLMEIMLCHSKFIKAHTNLLLSVYRHGDSRICNITSADVETCLQDAVYIFVNLYQVANRTELSLQVGACATLYAMSFHEMEIKYLLQWKSNAFVTYLRNLAVTSRRHNNALNKTRLLHPKLPLILPSWQTINKHKVLQLPCNLQPQTNQTQKHDARHLIMPGTVSMIYSKK
jgi:hypothetical protein